MKTFILTLLVVLITFSKSYSQDFWGKTNGFDSLTIYSLAINSNGDIFAGTKMTGVFRSTDNGDNWTNLGITNYDIYSIAPNSNDDIFVATYLLGGIYHSTDNGNNWTNIGLNHIDRSIAINSIGDIFVGTGAVGLWRTTDNGANWIQILFGSNCSGVNSLTINSDGYIFAGTIQGGTFRSTDNGDNWVQINQGLTNNNVYSLTINSNGDIFAGTSGGGVFRSTDNGNNWVEINQGITGEGLYVYSLTINSNGDIFAGTAAGVFRSIDNGDNWVKINQGLTNTAVHSLAINSGGIIFAGTENGIFRSLYSTTSIDTTETKIISSFKLYQNHPNPFNPITNIQYSISSNRFITLKVYDVLGNEIATLLNEEKPIGTYRLTWYAENLPSGVYFYKLQAGDFVETKKMILMK